MAEKRESQCPCQSESGDSLRSVMHLEVFVQKLTSCPIISFMETTSIATSANRSLRSMLPGGLPGIVHCDLPGEVKLLPFQQRHGATHPETD